MKASDTPNKPRRGKIGSLPPAIREELCRRMYNAEQGPKLLPWLNELPEVQRVLLERWEGVPVSAQNLSEWRRSGYTEWLAGREQAEMLTVLAEHAKKLAAASGNSLADGASSIAIARILELLQATAKSDIVGLATALAQLRDADAQMMRAKVKQELLARKDRALELAEARFQRTTAKLFIKWFTDKRAAEIIEGKGGRTVKMEQLIRLMFGDRVATTPAARDST